MGGPVEDMRWCSPSSLDEVVASPVTKKMAASRILEFLAVFKDVIAFFLSVIGSLLLIRRSVL
jgi:hypothetical protein